MSSDNIVLPEGWTSILDPTYNSYYYHHATSGKTQWEPPVLPSAETVIVKEDPSFSSNIETAENVDISAVKADNFTESVEVDSYSETRDQVAQVSVQFQTANNPSPDAPSA
jgi:hypothetical protein